MYSGLINRYVSSPLIKSIKFSFSLLIIYASAFIELLLATAAKIQIQYYLVRLYIRGVEGNRK